MIFFFTGKRMFWVHKTLFMFVEKDEKHIKSMDEIQIFEKMEKRKIYFLYSPIPYCHYLYKVAKRKLEDVQILYCVIYFIF
jgi:hypothetical protein